MSLVTEDGTGLANAESYTSVAEADLYHSNVNNMAWAALTTSVKEASLRKATNYLMQAYRLRWKGYRINLTQALDWPRYGVAVEDVGFNGYPSYVPVNIVPPLVKNACAELALRASAADLAPDLDRETLREKVGPIEVEYVPHTPQYKRYRSIDLMLRIYILRNGSRAWRS